MSFSSKEDPYRARFSNFEADMRERFDAVFQKSNVLKTGHFILSGDEHSREYLAVNEEILQNEDYLHEVAVILATIAEKNTEVFIGPASGGNKLAEAVKKAFTEIYKIDVAYVEMRKSDDGEQELPEECRQLLADRVVTVLEDVVTSGETVYEVVRQVREAGGDVIEVIALINRDPRFLKKDRDFVEAPFTVLKDYEIASYSEDALPEDLQDPSNISLVYGHGKTYLEERGLLN